MDARRLLTRKWYRICSKTLRSNRIRRYQQTFGRGDNHLVNRSANEPIQDLFVRRRYRSCLRDGYKQFCESGTTAEVRLQW